MNQNNNQNHQNVNEPAKGQRVFNLILVDESGSMGSIYHQAFNGINTTIKAIQTDAKNRPALNQVIDLITFDSEHYKIHMRNQPALKARTLTPDEYRPYAATPLLDAIGKSVTDLQGRVTDDDAVLVTIITDGLENASVEYTGASIKRLIDMLTEKGWVFTFIGANQDAIHEASQLGIKHALNFEATPDGTQEMWEREHVARHKFNERMERVANFSLIDKRRYLQDEANSEENFFDK